MTIIEALKTGLALRRRNKIFVILDQGGLHLGMPPIYLHPKAFKDPEYLLSCVHLTKIDLLAKDWLVQKPKKRKKA